MNKIKFLHCGDSAISVEFGNEINEILNLKVQKFCIALEQANINGVKEIVPTYRSALIYYDPDIILHRQIINYLERAIEVCETMEAPEQMVVEIPVTYGGQYGPDLPFVASYNNTTQEKVVKLHGGRDYLIYMLGFTPGFPYLGGVSEKIATPRLKKPRLVVPVGSVGIANTQTGIYTVESPGGWQIIGRTPLNLYDTKRQFPILLKAGQYVRFKSIAEQEYLKIEASVKENRYICSVYPKER